MNQILSIFQAWKIFTQKILFLFIFLSSFIFSTTYGQLDQLIRPINEAGDKLIQHQSVALKLVQGLAEALKKHDTLTQDVADLQTQVEDLGGTVQRSSKLKQALESVEAKVVGGLQEILNDISNRLKAAVGIRDKIIAAAAVDPRIQDTLDLGNKNALKKVPKNIMGEIRDFQAQASSGAGRGLKKTNKKEAGALGVDIDLAQQDNPDVKSAVKNLKYYTKYLEDKNNQQSYLKPMIEDTRGALEGGKGIFAEDQISESDELSTAFDGFANRISSIGKDINQETDPWTAEDKTAFITDEANTANIKSLITLIQEKLKKSPAHYKAYMSKY